MQEDIKCDGHTGPSGPISRTALDYDGLAKALALCSKSLYLRSNKLQSAIANIVPAGILAEQHRKMAEPGSGKKAS